MSNDLNVQFQNAFEFINKLHHEISYLIKEVEGILQQEDEQFIIGRPGGYQVTTRTSTGLEPVNVEYWMPKTFTVFFRPGEQTAQSVTNTKFHESLRLLLIHIDLFRKDVNKPRIIFGCLNKVLCHRPEKFKKFEQIVGKFPYHHHRILHGLPNISYTDGDCTLEGYMYEEDLFSINSSDDISNNIIPKMLNLYRK